MAEINQAQINLLPAGVRPAAVTIDKALAHFGTPENWDLLAEDYLEELSQVPTDLLPIIWTQVRRTCRFFPKISELLGMVSEQVATRRLKLMRLQSIQKIYFEREKS